MEFEDSIEHCKLQLLFFLLVLHRNTSNHYIQPTLNEENVKRDIAILPIGINDVLSTEADKELIAESVTDIAKKCVCFGVKDVSVSTTMVNTRLSSAFIGAVNKIPQHKFQRITLILLITRTSKKNTSEQMSFI